jgi:hypothetical protein
VTSFILRYFAIPAAVLFCAFSISAQTGKHPGPPSPQPIEAQPVAKSAPASAPPPFPYTEAVRANNIGVALMNLHRFADAVGRFQSACILDAQSDTGCVNAGIGFLYARHYEDAGTMLTKITQQDPQNPFAWFNLALLQHAVGNNSAALADFQHVAAIDPADADTHYFLGFFAVQAGQYQQAATEFQRAIDLDPNNASAEFGLGQVEARLGDEASAKAHMARFEEITSKGLGKPVEFVYGEQGKYSRAQEMSGLLPGVAPAAIPIHFADVSAALGLPKAVQIPTYPKPSRAPNSKRVPAQPAPPSLANFLGSGACVFDYDGDGRPDIFLVNANGSGAAALLRNIGHGKFVDATRSANLKFLGEGTGCAVGDYDNDGRPDLVISGADGITLFHNVGPGAGPGKGSSKGAVTFKDVTDAAGVRTIGLAMGVTFLDCDRNGRLDLYVTRFNDFPLAHPSQPFEFPDDAAPPGNILWRNLGSGTFVDATQETGLAGGAASVGALASDLSRDGTLDLVVTGWAKSPALMMSAREEPFRAANPFGPAAAGRAAGVVALDFDRDGRMDLAFTQWTPPGLTLWRNVAPDSASSGVRSSALGESRVAQRDFSSNIEAARPLEVLSSDIRDAQTSGVLAPGAGSAADARDRPSFQRVPLPDPGWMRGWGVAALDYDNDGLVDLVAVGETFAGKGRIILLRNEGAAGFRDMTHATGLDKIALHNPRSVIAFDAEGDGSTYLLITQSGAPPVLLKAVGGNENNWVQVAASGEPDNRMGLGTKVEIFSGAYKQTWEVPAASGYLGQGPPEISSGLGDESAAGVIRLRWPSGAVQDEIQVAGAQRTPITEMPDGDSAK